MNIKGHRLGETPQEFLQADPKFAEHIAHCHAEEPKPISAEEIKSMSNDQMYAVALSYSTSTTMATGQLVGTPSRKELEKLADQGLVLTEDHRFAAEKVFCTAAIAAIEKDSPEPFYSDTFFPDLDLSTAMYQFYQGKLVKIILRIKGQDFQTTEKELAERIGVQPQIEHPEMQNAMGAVWKDQVATWLTPDVFGVLADSRNPAKPRLDMTVEARSFYDLEEKERNSKPSALD